MTPKGALERYIAAPTQDHRDAVVIAYQYLCRRGAQKFLRPGNDRSDLAQVAAIGLIKAVATFEPLMQTPFEAYAWMLIVGELMHYVRDHERLVRLPRSLRALELRYTTTVEKLESRSGRRVTNKEIAAELSIGLPVIDELRAIRGGRNIVSLDDEDAVLAGDVANAGRRLSIDEQLALRLAVGALCERERTIVLGLFATGLSQTELGERLGLSQSHISKLMKKALHKLYRAVA